MEVPSSQKFTQSNGKYKCHNIQIFTQQFEVGARRLELASISAWTTLPHSKIRLVMVSVADTTFYCKTSKAWLFLPYWKIWIHPTRWALSVRTRYPLPPPLLGHQRYTESHSPLYIWWLTPSVGAGLHTALHLRPVCTLSSIHRTWLGEQLGPAFDQEWVFKLCRFVPSTVDSSCTTHGLPPSHTW